MTKFSCQVFKRISTHIEFCFFFRVKVEMLCNMLCLPDLPEHTLPKLCSSILAPSNDLSYITATKFIKSLLLKKVRE